MADSRHQQLVAGIARDVVAKIAPNELPLFEVTSEAYFRDPNQVRKQRRASDQPLAFGVGELAQVATPIVLLIATEVVTYVMEPVKQSIVEWIGERIKQLFGAGNVGRAKTSTIQMAEASPSAETLRQARERGLKIARDLNLPDEQAALVVDSVLVQLATASG